MDLGINGRRAVICASSRGLGRACAEALAAEGVHVVLNGRNPETLARTLEEMAERFPGQVSAVAADITTPGGRDALLTACPDPDILVVNNAGPAPGSFAAFDEADWTRALDANMIAGLMLIRAVIGTMRARKFGRIINITSAMVTTPRPHMGLSAGARAGLTAVLKGLSFEVAPDNVTINSLLPERIDTDRQRFMAQRVMDAQGISYAEARRLQEQSIAAGRLGRPEEFGAVCAFFCAANAGFVSGANIHVDGGSYPALI